METAVHLKVYYIEIGLLPFIVYVVCYQICIEDCRDYRSF